MFKTKGYGIAKVLGYDEINILVKYKKTESTGYTGSYELPMVTITGKDVITGTKVEYYDSSLFDYFNNDYSIKHNAIYINSLEEITEEEALEYLKNTNQAEIEKYVNTIIHIKLVFMNLKDKVNHKKEVPSSHSLKDEIKRVRTLAKNSNIIIK